MRYMLLLKTEENSPAGMPPKELMDAIFRYGEEMAKAGVLLDTGGLAPTVMATRIRVASSGEVTVTDGPFTEAKEVIASYAMIEAASKEAAVEFSTTFMDLHKQHWPGWAGESEVRQIFGADSPPPFAG
ncbi:YciI family protein [Sphaerisporangium sp. NPDC005288]|uniref:YciI family protein n=1 Tax=unclassified Sphaerisporangium TaxID=2630420 RepID=UPI0033AFA802